MGVVSSQSRGWENGRAGASTQSFGSLQNQPGEYGASTIHSFSLERSISTNPAAHGYQLPCFHFPGEVGFYFISSIVGIRKERWN